MRGSGNGRRAQRVRDRSRRRGPPPARGNGEFGPAHRRDRDRRLRRRGPLRRRAPALRGRRPGGGGRGHPAEAPVRRSAPPPDAGQPPAARPGQRGAAIGHGPPGVLRSGDPHAVGAHPRGGAGVRRAQPLAPRLLLRPAPEPPDRQTAVDGGGDGPLLPGGQVHARRGPASRPAVRVHPARRGSVVRGPGRRAQVRLRGGARRRRGGDGGAPAGHRADDVVGRAGSVRHGQTGPAFRHGAGGPVCGVRGNRGKGVQRPVRESGPARGRGRR